MLIEKNGGAPPESYSAFGKLLGKVGAPDAPAQDPPDKLMAPGPQLKKTKDVYKKVPSLKDRRRIEDPTQVAVKLEPAIDSSHAPFYRITPSPPDTPPCDGGFHAGACIGGAGSTSSSSYMTVAHHHARNGVASMYAGSSSMDSQMSFASTSAGGGGNHHHHQNNGAIAGPSHLQLLHCTTGESHAYGVEPFRDAHSGYDTSVTGMPCPCLSNAGALPCYINLARQLETSKNLLQTLHEHGQHRRCVVYRRLVELHTILQCVFFSLDFCWKKHGFSHDNPIFFQLKITEVARYTKLYRTSIRTSTPTADSNLNPTTYVHPQEAKS